MKKIYLFLLLLLCFSLSEAQTTLISPSTDGGFELATPTGTPATDFSANGWTVVNGSFNQFYVGNAAGSSAGLYSAFTGTSSTTWANTANATVSHIYKDITVPGTDAKFTLTFKYKVSAVDATFDYLKAFIVPTTTVPVAGTQLTTGQIGVTAGYDGTTSYVTYTISGGVSPGTQRLVLSFRQDGVSPYGAASIDEISFVTAPATSITSTAIGGLFSSPATWVGGVVPNGDDATIADGATVTVDQIVTVRDLTVGGGSSGILNWNGTASQIAASRDVMINAGANLNLYSAAASPTGNLFYVGRNFTNNGTVHAGYSNASLLFTDAASSPTISGAGTFVGNIVHQIQFATTGNSVINTSSNLITRSFAATAGSVNTNGKLTIDNTAQVYGLPLNQQVYSISVTAMGAGYTSAPTVTISAPPSGTTATAVANYDAVTGTVRSVTITNPGSGYIANPTVTFTGGGFTTTATAIAVVPALSIGVTASQIQKSGVATITGGINIKSDQAVGGITSANGGVGYTSAPSVGFGLPITYLNLVTAGGSGYTSAPTVTVTGGTQLIGGAAPAFTVTVASGQVVSVVATGGGTLWTSLPTLTLTGGGGSGATAAYPAGCLPTANASIANGAVNNYTITNGGFGYSAAPAVGIVGGGFTTAATAPTCRVGLYNLILGYFSPAPSNVAQTEPGIIPANRRINALTMNSALGANFTGGDLDLYASVPLTLTNGILNVGTNTLYGSSLAYAGQTGSLTSSVSGNIKLNTPGGSVTRNFPYDATFTVATGSGSVTTGSTIQTLTASRTGAPTGTADLGVPTGTRAYRLRTNPGAVYGIAPTVTLNFNSNDALTSDNAGLYVAQAASQTGPWTVRSTSTGTGSLPATGSRTTATTTPGPIVPTGDDYFGFTTTTIVNQTVASGDWSNPAIWSTGVVPSCADNVIINNTHNVTVTTAGNISKNVTINATGSLSVNNGDVAVGCTLNNATLTNNGTLSITGGTMNVNGGINFVAASTFNMSAGMLNVDPNDGTSAGSYSNTNGTFYINTNLLNVTGGNINLLDPPYTSGQRVFAYSVPTNDVSFSGSNTMTLGGGTNTNPANTQGFYIECNVSTGTLGLNNLVVNSGRFSNQRHMSTYAASALYITKTKNLTVNAGSEVVINLSSLHVTGDVVNDGYITTTGTFANSATNLAGALGFVGDAQYSSAVVLSPSSNAQSLTGSGFFKQGTADADPTSQTGNVIGGLVVYHTSASPGLTLGMPLTVSNALKLFDGKVNTTSTNYLGLGLPSTLTGNPNTLIPTAGTLYNSSATAPATSAAYAPGGWATGMFKRFVLSAVSAGNAGLMPVGSDTSRTAQVIFTAAPTTGGYLDATWFDASGGNNGLPLTEPAVSPSTINSVAPGYWQVLNEGALITAGTYTARFTNTRISGIIDPLNTTLIKRANSASPWALEGTHVASTGTATSLTASRTNLTTFSEFAIGGNASVVPVAIEFFRGSKQTTANYLDWKVSCTSAPSVILNLERSADGAIFVPIQTQSATAVRCQQEFNYTDVSAPSGISYYRLKIITPDGKFRYSNIVALLNKVQGFELISLAPNPVQTAATLNITSVKAGMLNIAVSDVNGRVIMKQAVIMIAGNSAAGFDFSKLSAGTYHITAVNADGDRKTITFIKY